MRRTDGEMRRVRGSFSIRHLDQYTQDLGTHNEEYMKQYMKQFNQQPAY